MFQIDKNVKFADNRVFVDIGKGCGFSCSYCYCEESRLPQKIFNSDDINMMAKYIVNHIAFNKGVTGTVVSLCPHTEPLMSKESQSLILDLIKLIAPYGNIIQISTKSVIPDDFLKKLSFIVCKGQVVIFVSISSIFKISEYEPFAPSLDLRLNNIKKCKMYGISSCLYVKPFFITGENECSKLDDVIYEYKPDAICTGIVYAQNKEKGNYIHPTNPNIKSEGVHDEIVDYNKRSDNISFLTSSCVLASINKIKNSVDIPRKLCIRCNPNCYNQKWDI